MLFKVSFALWEATKTISIKQDAIRLGSFWQDKTIIISHLEIQSPRKVSYPIFLSVTNCYIIIIAIKLINNPGVVGVAGKWMMTEAPAMPSCMTGRVRYALQKERGNLGIFPMWANNDQEPSQPEVHQGGREAYELPDRGQWLEGCLEQVSFS